MRRENTNRQNIVYGMLRKPRRKIDGVKLIPSVCPMCGEDAWKTTLADKITANGGRAMCVKCAMWYAWRE